jgi:tripartite-type tricarboxylate transporter receptor subunit TctC
MKKILAALLMTSALAHADVTVVSSFPSGSAPDMLTRKIADVMGHTIIDNKPGGNGIIALDYFQKANKDGSTILFTSAETIASTPILYNKESLVSDLKPVAMVSETQWVLITGPNVTDIKAAVKNHPYYGSWAIGSNAHLAGAEFSKDIGANTTHVPYKEYGTWLTDVSNGVLTFSFATIGSTQQLEAANKLKYVAVTSQQRNPSYPNVPTMRELIGRDIKAKPSFTGFFINKNVDPAKQKELAGMLRSAVQSSEVQALIVKLNLSPLNTTDAQSEAMVIDNYKVFKEQLTQYNISIK